jgi:L-fuconolactonase
MQQIIDTHVHIWDFEKAAYPWLVGDTSILNRTYKIEEIESDRKEVGVVHGVLVQASCNLDDTNFMLQIAAEQDWLKGVVCWLPLQDVKETEHLLQTHFLPNKYFVGVRHLIHDEQDPKWLLKPQVINSLRILAVNNIPYDVVGVLPEHLRTVLQVAELVPELRMVFDHLNAPPISTQQKFGEWGILMKEAAKNKKLFCKISGLGTASGNYADRTENEIKPYVEFILEQFGIQRCFCGGDWPVSLLANTYKQTWQQTKNIVQALVPSQQLHLVYFENAKKFYNLKLV